MENIRKEILQYCQLLSVPEAQRPIPAHSAGAYDRDGIWYSYRWKHYVACVIERGEVIEKKCFRSKKDFLYFVFFDITLSMAFQKESRQRRENEDPRRQAFEIQKQLLNAIDESFAWRASEEHEALLYDFPAD